MNTTLKEITDWLPDKTECYPADGGWVEIVTSNLSFNNDNLAIFLKTESDGTHHFSDGKQTLRELEMVGVSMANEDQRKEIDRILQLYGVHHETEEISITSTIDDREDAFGRILGAMKTLLNLAPLQITKRI